MDFGIARAMSDAQATMTQTAQVIGTAQYLSPEQARGERVDARSDLYSTGCLMYELLTGRPPFTGDSPVAIAYQHVRENPIPPSRLDPDLPPWADAIVLKAMAKAAGDRYQSAAEMQADLQRAASGMQVAAMAAPPTRAEYFGDYDDYRGYGDRTQRMGQTSVGGPPTGQYPQRTGSFDGYGDGGGYPPRKSWARRWLPWLIPLVVIIAAIAVAAALLMNNGKTNYVPSVNGESLQQAEAQITQAGLTYTAVGQGSQTVPKNQVITTNPANGSSVTSGEQVTIYYSTGVGKVSVPNFTSNQTSENAAVAQLTKLGLNPNIEADNGSTLPQGTVAKQSPAPGTSVNPGATVTLWVSGGGVKVPSVIGDSSYLTAEQTLQNAGFQVTPQAEAAPASQPVNPGEVWSENPGGGTLQPAGTTITIFYQPQATSTPTPTTTPSTTPSATVSPTPTATSSATPGLPGGF
jgi:eukaryotic-like serine/threonine-protein kinase